MPALAHAQTETRVAVGAALGVRASGRADATGAVRPVLLWRLGHGTPGWGFRYGFNWFSSDLERAVDGRPAAFGHLNVRPILLGYGYHFAVTPRLSISPNLKAGYAFSAFSMRRDFSDRYEAALGAQRVSADVHNTFVLKPEVSAWVDVSRKIGINVTAGYMIAHPKLSLSSSAGTDLRRIDADMFMMKVGAVYSVF